MDRPTSLKFGTSGLRGLVSDLEGQPARRYAAAFLRYLLSQGFPALREVYLGGDYRPSSAAIVNDCVEAVNALGLSPVVCGVLPTPALALHAMEQGGAAIMVTGSHIPADRNGLKFYSPAGEIGKEDEAGILAALDTAVIENQGKAPRDESADAQSRYLARFATLLNPALLTGLRIGVFEHSSVARDLIGQVLAFYGAEIVRLGRIDGFVPVDTEAFGDEVFSPLRGWVENYRLDAIVSADGDGDRPLLMDSEGHFIRGDVLGLLAARHLGASTVVTPVTSNSAIERTGYFKSVVRTRVGSPYVVQAISEAEGAVVGFEANGGTFVGEGITLREHRLPPLPTRDAILPLLCALGEAVRQGKSLAQVHAELPLQHALADRLQDVPGERSAAFLKRLAEDPEYAARLFAPHGISRLAAIDGLQFWTRAGHMVHFRASGNAPELRCYVEADTAEGAMSLLQWGLSTAGREVSA